MRVNLLRTLTSGEGLEGTIKAIRSPLEDLREVETSVRAILQSVKEQGDVGLQAAVATFDLAGEPPVKPLQVSAEDLEQAAKVLPQDIQSALNVAITNVALTADAAVHEQRTVSLPQGHSVLLREIPVRRAAVYVPAGRAPYLSTLVMGVVTARAAGVSTVAVAASPSYSGDIHPAILGACGLCGVTEVYRMGGAQAVAAFAYGTETVLPVDVIVGPGNNYVQVAKQLVAGRVGIDGFAGPSDLVIFAQEDTEVDLLVTDLLAQAEHGQGSVVVCLSTSRELLEQLKKKLEVLLQTAECANFGDCFLVPVETVELGFTFINGFAPEHLQLIGETIESQSQQVQAAGCIFIGAHTPATFGDYVAGSNHVLPTAGAARFSSMLGPRHFRKQVAEVRIPRQAVDALTDAGAKLAQLEGFTWHQASMQARLTDE